MSTKLTKHEYELCKFILLHFGKDYDGMSILKRFGDLRKEKATLKSLIRKGVVEYDGFDPDNYCTRNPIREGENWVEAIGEYQKENLL